MGASRGHRNPREVVPFPKASDLGDGDTGKHEPLAGRDRGTSGDVFSVSGLVRCWREWEWTAGRRERPDEAGVSVQFCESLGVRFPRATRPGMCFVKVTGAVGRLIPGFSFQDPVLPVTLSYDCCDPASPRLRSAVGEEGPSFPRHAEPCDRATIEHRTGPATSSLRTKLVVARVGSRY